MLAEREGLPITLFTPAEIRAWEVLEAQAQEMLAGRRSGFKISEVRFEPSGSNILVYRTPPKERRTASGRIVIPSVTSQDKDEYGNKELADIIVDIGVLISAGLEARDWMRSHGIFLGDYVRFGHYAGREMDVQWFDTITDVPPDDLKNLLLLKAQDLQGSFDLHWRLYGDRYEKDGKKYERAPVLRRVWALDGEGNGIHVLKPITKKEN